MNESRFFLPYPPSVNQLFAGKSRRHKSEQYKNWLKLAAIQLKQESEHIQLHKGQVSLYFAFRAPDNCRRDIDNLLKATIDFLVDNKIIIADDQRFVRKITAEWLGEGNKSGCFVCIKDYESIA